LLAATERKGLTLVGAVLLFFSVSRTAGQPLPPPSYTQPSPNGKYLLVMISKMPLEDELQFWDEERARALRQLRETYKVSGLYPNDGSTTPLWTIDWFATDIFVASDGIHLIRRGGPSSLSGSDAVTFFARGQQLKLYRIVDLIPNFDALPASTTTARWLAEDHFDDAALRYTVWTNQGREYVFDVSTGEIISSRGPGRWPIVASILAVVLVAAGAGLWWRRQRARAQPPAAPGTAQPMTP
jgi:hypothetical protein